MLVVQYCVDGVVSYAAHVQVAMTIVDDVEEPPELQKDIFWNQVIEKVYFSGVSFLLTIFLTTFLNLQLTLSS